MGNSYSIKELKCYCFFLTFIGYSLKANPSSDMVTDLNQIHQKYIKEKPEYAANLTQHEFISQYTEALAISLSVWDGRRQEIGYYKKLAWGGLESSPAYQKLSSKEKYETQTIIRNEATGSNKAKSVKCK